MHPPLLSLLLRHTFSPPNDIPFHTPPPSLQHTHTTNTHTHMHHCLLLPLPPPPPPLSLSLSRTHTHTHTRLSPPLVIPAHSSPLPPVSPIPPPLPPLRALTLTLTVCNELQPGPHGRRGPLKHLYGQGTCNTFLLTLMHCRRPSIR